MTSTFTCPECGWHQLPGDPPASCPGCAHARKVAAAAEAVHVPQCGQFGFEPRNNSERRDHMRIRRRLSRDGALG